MAIRVFHADDHQTFRDGMRLILEREADIEVVGSAGDGRGVQDDRQAEAGRGAARSQHAWGRSAGDRAAIARRATSVKVLILTMFDSPAYVHEAVTAGALGYLLKEAPGEEVVRAVRSVAAGRAISWPR